MKSQREGLHFVRYVREAGQWVKITRDPAARRFECFRGWAGEFRATDRRVLGFEFFPTWADAERVARQWIADHA